MNYLILAFCHLCLIRKEQKSKCHICGSRTVDTALYLFGECLVWEEQR